MSRFMARATLVRAALLVVLFAAVVAFVAHEAVSPWATNVLADAVHLVEERAGWTSANSEGLRGFLFRL